MLPDFLARDTVIVLSPVMGSDHGTAVPDWRHPPFRTTITGCSVQPASSTDQEPSTGSQGVTTSWVVYAPPETVCGHLDRIVWNGATYAVIGEPALWVGLGLDHLKITITGPIS